MSSRDVELELEAVDDELLELDAPPVRCRGCGCDDDHACPGGCRWVEPDLCSACADAQADRSTTAIARRRLAGRRVA